MSVQYLNEEHYCTTCSRVLPPGDAPGSMCRECFYVRRAPRQSVTPARVTVLPAVAEVTPNVCPKCGLQGSHSANACRQRRHRQRREQA